MGEGLGGPVMHEFPPRTWEATRSRAWAQGGAAALGLFGLLVVPAFSFHGSELLVPVRVAVCFAGVAGAALLWKAFIDARRVRALRRDCARLGCSAWTATHGVTRTTERRRSWLVRRGLPWYEIRANLVGAADSSAYPVAFLLAFGASRYGLRGTIEARLEQDLTAAGTGTPYVARVHVERWPDRVSQVELRFWLVLVVEPPRRRGLLRPEAVLLDCIPPRRIAREAAVADAWSVEFDVPAAAPPGDVLADPPVYWALVMEGGEEPFVFRSVFSAAICRFDDVPVSSSPPTSRPSQRK